MFIVVITKICNICNFWQDRHLIFDVGHLARLEDLVLVVLAGRGRLLQLREEHLADLALLQRVRLLQDLLVQPVRVLDPRNGIGDALENTLIL
jgi:hypothetical protein